MYMHIYSPTVPHSSLCKQRDLYDAKKKQKQKKTQMQKQKQTITNYNQNTTKSKQKCYKSLITVIVMFRI